MHLESFKTASYQADNIFALADFSFDQFSCSYAISQSDFQLTHEDYDIASTIMEGNLTVLYESL